MGGLSTLVAFVWAVTQYAETVPGWMVGVIEAACVLPVAGGIFELLNWLAEQKQQRRRKEWGSEDSVAAPAHFRLGPWEDTPKDRDHFQRADGLHYQIADWLRQPPELCCISLESQVAARVRC